MRDHYIGIDNEHARILRYGANHNGKRAVVKIEIEVTDPDALAWILRDITRAQEGQKAFQAAAAEQARAEKKAARARPAAIGRQELLGLPYYGSEK